MKAYVICETDTIQGTVGVTLIHGTKTRGIGYSEGKPVIVTGGVVQQAPNPGEKTQWRSEDSIYFAVAEDNRWVALKHGASPGSGWRLW